MGEAIGEVLPFAVGVALSPITIIAVVVILATPKAKINGPAFLIGGVLGMAVVGIVLLQLSGAMDMGESGDPSTRSSYIKLGLGIILVGVALRRLRARISGGGSEELPGWIKTLDDFSAIKVAGLAALLAGVNPKNLLLIAAAVMAISQSGVSAEDEATALAVFVAIGSIGIAIPVGIYFLMRDRAESLLGALRS